jgi:hypothetical protein
MTGYRTCHPPWNISRSGCANKMHGGAKSSNALADTHTETRSTRVSPAPRRKHTSRKATFLMSPRVHPHDLQAVPGRCGRTFDRSCAGRGSIRLIVIGENVWFGAKAILLPGISIGDDFTVGAGRIVTREVPPATTVMRIHARPRVTRAPPWSRFETFSLITAQPGRPTTATPRLPPKFRNRRSVAPTRPPRATE